MLWRTVSALINYRKLLVISLLAGLWALPSSSLAQTSALAGANAPAPFPASVCAEMILRGSWSLAPSQPPTDRRVGEFWQELLKNVPLKRERDDGFWRERIAAFFNARSYGTRLWIADGLRYELARQSANDLPQTDGELIRWFNERLSLLAAQDAWQPWQKQCVYTAWHGLVRPYCYPMDPKGVDAAQVLLAQWLDAPSPNGPPAQAFISHMRTLVDQRFSAKSMQVVLTTIFAREGLEASVVLFAILSLAVAQGGPAARRSVWKGVAAGLIASAALFWTMEFPLRTAFSAFRWVALISVSISAALLFVVSGWVWHKFYWGGWFRLLRKLDRAEFASHHLIWLCMGMLAVLREGIELSLLTHIILQGQSTSHSLIGGLYGLAIALTAAAIVFGLHRWLPLRRLLTGSAVLIALTVTIFAGYGVRLLQTTSWLAVTPIEGWQWPAWVGLWFGLFPTRQGLWAQGLAISYVLLAATPFLWHFFKRKLHIAGDKK